METSEKQWIISHLSDLTLYTICNETLLAFMQEKRILSFSDVDTINAIPQQTGKANKFYEIIQTRTNAYAILLDGLRKTNQFEIIDLLESGHLPETLNVDHRMEQLFGASRAAVIFSARPPDALFSGRQNELESLNRKIKQGFTSPNKVCVVVISGLGGIGKTQLCRKYVELYKKDFRENVMWINASCENSLVEDFATLARDNLKISTKDENANEKSIETLVNEVYKYVEKRRCLFVLDNVENKEYLMKYLPLRRTYPGANVRPTVIMTSRETEWDIEFDVVKLHDLEESDAVAMIRNGLRGNECLDDKDAHSLVNRFQCFPLAIRQAVSYILLQQVTNQKYTIQNYLEDLGKREEEMMSFYNSEVCTKLSSDYVHTMFSTWAVTLQKIYPSRPASILSFLSKETADELVGKVAIRILNCMAYIASENIGIEILKLLAGERYDELIFVKALSLLVRHSMINGNHERNLFSVHKLVQNVTRINLGKTKQEGKLLSEILQVLSSNLNKIDTLQHAIMAWKHSNDALRMKFMNLPAKIVKKLVSFERIMDGYSFAGDALDDLQKLQKLRGLSTSNMKSIQNEMHELRYLIKDKLYHK